METWIIHEIIFILIAIVLIFWMKKDPYVHHYQVGIYLLICGLCYLPMTYFALDNDRYGYLFALNMLGAGLLCILVDWKDLVHWIFYKIPIMPRRMY